MKKLLCFVFLGMVFFAGGCAQYWYQEGKTFNQCMQDRDECFAELSKRSDLSGLTVQYEVEYMADCMEQKGYRLVTEKELPLDAKRQVPETSLSWRARGIAGALDK